MERKLSPTVYEVKIALIWSLDFPYVTVYIRVLEKIVYFYFQTTITQRITGVTVKSWSVAESKMMK